MACTGCTGCGCTNPTSCAGGPGTCSANCTGGTAQPGYRFCVWPAISGQGCLPGGDCHIFANQNFCLVNTGTDVWKTAAITVDCTTTYGVVVDVVWTMTFAGAAVTLSCDAYLTGTTTLVANIAVYTGSVDLARCDKTFSVGFSSSGGQCDNWPPCLIVSPGCCQACESGVAGCATCSNGVPPCSLVCGPNNDPPRCFIHGLTATDNSCAGGGCATAFDGSVIEAVWAGGCAPFCCCNADYNASKSVAMCSGNADPLVGWTLILIADAASAQITITFADGAGSSTTAAKYSCSTFNCGTSNTFSLVQESTICNFPATITQTWT